MNNSIFIDFFDTLVHRSIPPEDVKKLWSQKLATLLKIHEDIYELRFLIEAKLCAENFELHQEQEFVFNVMCQHLYTKLEHQISIKYDEFLAIARELELVLEQHVQYLNQEYIAYLTAAKQEGAQIFLISDFYLDRELFNSLLQYHKIDFLFNDLFISCEYLASKRSGKLYSIIKEKLGKEVFVGATMLGDNQLADFKNAQSAGLVPKLINAANQHKYYQEFSTYSDISKTMNAFNVSYKISTKIVYPEIALALYNFVTKLYTKLCIDGAKDVLFMAREGEFLIKLFESYVNLVGGNIKAHYFYVSRRATFLPSLAPLKEEDFHVLFRQYINISPQEFLLNLNFEERQIVELINEFKFDLTVRITNLPASSEFKLLISNHKFASFYEQNRLEQIAGFNQHLNNMGVEKQNLYVVDVGWKGSIQDNLAKILPNSTIYGYYFGLNLPGSDNTHSYKNGLLFDVNTAWDTSKYAALYNESTSIFEIILGASHGSTKKYKQDGSVELLKNDIEEQLYFSTVKHYQEQIAEYIKLISGIVYWKGYSSNDVEQYTNQQFANFILSPSDKQVSIYSDLYHVESFGVHETTSFKSQKSNIFSNLIKFIKNPKTYIRTAFWPAQKLKNEQLWFLIPFYKYYRLRKLQK